MELLHIPLRKLYPSPLNMRHGKAEPDVSDILPLVRARGILVPLLVRPDGERYEIVAGKRLLRGPDGRSRGRRDRAPALRRAGARR